MTSTLIGMTLFCIAVMCCFIAMNKKISDMEKEIQAAFNDVTRDVNHLAKQDIDTLELIEIVLDNQRDVSDMIENMAELTADRLDDIEDTLIDYDIICDDCTCDCCLDEALEETFTEPKAKKEGKKKTSKKN